MHHDGNSSCQFQKDKHKILAYYRFTYYLFSYTRTFIVACIIKGIPKHGSDILGDNMFESRLVLSLSVSGS